MSALWLTGGTLVTARGLRDGVLEVREGRLAAIRRSAPRGARRVSARGAYIAPGCIDLHVWGDPRVVAPRLVREGTTAFLTTLGPEPRAALLARVRERAVMRVKPGAQCLGVHLEGPFVNPRRAGALSTRWMRPPALAELAALARAGGVRLVTMAPELPGAARAIAWCRRRRIRVSLGHSVATDQEARHAVEAGAAAVTHVFNGMPPFHHRTPSLLDVALTEPRLTTMVIADGVHVSPSAFQLLVRVKGTDRVALVTDSIAAQGWSVVRRHGAYYTRRGLLAGSDLTMLRAVRNAVRWGGIELPEAMRMATEVPARLLGVSDDRGGLRLGARADLVIFDAAFRVRLTMVGGRIVYQRGE